MVIHCSNSCFICFYTCFSICISCSYRFFSAFSCCTWRNNANLFSIFFKYDFRTASGNGKVIIVVSNLIALVNYIIEGSILYEIAIPATIANIAGCYLGASLAVKNGKKLVKKFLFAVVIILIVQAILKLFKVI